MADPGWVSTRGSHNTRKRFKFFQMIEKKPVFSLSHISCQVPNWKVEIHWDGSIYHCCPSWLPTPVANIKNVSILQAMESDMSKKIRASIDDGSYAYCRKDFCPFLAAYLGTGRLTGSLVDKALPSGDYFSMEVDRHISISLCYDSSCNLACPSCRSGMTLYTVENIPPETREVHSALLRSLEELLVRGYFVRLVVTGSGDPFASPLFSDLLQGLEYKSRLTLELHTNGTLMEERRFTDAMMRMTKRIYVSVDAAYKETYDKIRLNGSFPKLVKNLEWLNLARARGDFPKLAYVKVNMVVQKDNFREIEDFARWMLGFECVDEIWFNKITDWGHLSSADFHDKAVWKEDHADHKEFLDCVRRPFLRSDPKINLGNLAAYL
jgi:MoaA/NifB/PqqE/SkfB family radical SAM enzyme